MQGWKKVWACPLLAALALPAQADVLGIKFGGQVWNLDGEGTVGNADQSSRADFDFDDESQNVFYVAIEHPVPILPNVKLKRTELETRGDGQVSGFTFEGVSFNGSVNSDVDFTHTDIILYYELLDNWLNLDLGVNVMQFDGEVRVTSSSQNAEVDFDGYLPTLYLAARGDLPLTGLSIGAEVSGLAAGGHHFYDAEATLQYAFIDNPAVDVAVQLGYRQTSLELEDLDELDTDLEFSGPFAGLQVHF